MFFGTKCSRCGQKYWPKRPSGMDRNCEIATEEEKALK